MSQRIKLVGSTLAMVAVATALTFYACSKSDSGDKKGNKKGGDPHDEIPSGLAASNRLALAYPEGLAVAAFPQKVQSVALQGATEPETAAEKLEQAEQIITGEAANCVQGNILATSTNQANGGNCYSTDTDLSSGTNESGEACMVAYTRSQMDSTIALVDSATGLTQAFMCQAKKTGLATELPSEVGGVIDGTQMMQAAMTNAPGAQAGTTILEAKITRLASEDSRPVFRTDFQYRVNGKTSDVHIVHSPASATDNSTYNGQLWMRLNIEDQDPQQENHGTPHLSLTYARSGTVEAPQVKFALRFANWNRADDPFTSTGLLDMNTGADANGNWAGIANANQALNAIRYITFDMNPLTYEGSLAFWVNPGGNYVEAPRGLVFNVERNSTTGVYTGCSISGADTQHGSIRKSLADGNAIVPTGYYHPQANPQVETKVYKQCFAQNTTTGLWELTTAYPGFELIQVGANTVDVPDITAVEAFRNDIKPAE